MLDTFVCWGIAIGLLYSKTEGITSDYVRILFAMGFIFLGILCRAVYVYQVTHTVEINVDTDENGNIVVSNAKK